MPRPRSDAKPRGSRWSDEKKTEALIVFGICGCPKQTARQVGVPRRTVVDWIKAAKPEEIERYRREASDVVGERALTATRTAIDCAHDALERDGATLGPVDAARVARDLSQTYGKLADARQVRERVQRELDREIDLMLDELRDGLNEDAFRAVLEIVSKRRVARPADDENTPDDTALPLRVVHGWEPKGPPPGGWFVVNMYDPHGWEQHHCGRYVPAEWWIDEVRAGTRNADGADRVLFAKAIRAGAVRWGPPVIPMPAGMRVAQAAETEHDTSATSNVVPITGEDLH